MHIIRLLLSFAAITMRFASMEDLKGKKTANTITSTYASQAEAYGATVTGVDDLNSDYRAAAFQAYRCNT